MSNPRGNQNGPAGTDIPVTPEQTLRTPGGLRIGRLEDPENIVVGAPADGDAPSFIQVGTEGRFSTTASVNFGTPNGASTPQQQLTPRGAGSSFGILDGPQAGSGAAPSMATTVLRNGSIYPNLGPVPSAPPASGIFASRSSVSEGQRFLGVGQVPPPTVPVGAPADAQIGATTKAKESPRREIEGRRDRTPPRSYACPRRPASAGGSPRQRDLTPLNTRLSGEIAGLIGRLRLLGNQRQDMDRVSEQGAKEAAEKRSSELKELRESVAKLVQSPRERSSALTPCPLPIGGGTILGGSPKGQKTAPSSPRESFLRPSSSGGRLFEQRRATWNSPNGFERPQSFDMSPRSNPVDGKDLRRAEMAMIWKEEERVQQEIEARGERKEEEEEKERCEGASSRKGRSSRTPRDSSRK